MDLVELLEGFLHSTFCCEVRRRKQGQPEQKQAWEQLLERVPLESARHLGLEPR